MTAHIAADKTDARLAAWVPPAGSADADLLDELSTITPRARDLSRNNPLGAAAKQTYADNIIGSQLRLSALPRYRLLDWDKDQSSEWANLTEDQFSTWAETTECDAARTQTLLSLTVQALTGAMMNGDAIAVFHWLPRQGSVWSTRIQAVESDRLATPPWLMHDASVRGGVKIDNYGAPLGYWILKHHPGDANAQGLTPDRNQWTYVPAFTGWGRRRVIHLFDKERSGQNRGKSVFTSVMREFRVAGEYMGAELHAAVINAMIAAFLETDLDQQSVSEMFGNDPEGTYWKSVSEKWNRKKLETGMIQTLPMGTKLSGYDPNRPNTAFDGFMESVMRHIAAGLNLPYELLLKDFSKTNYSSARAALLEAWRYFQSRRKWLSEQWLNPIYETWMEEAINIGKVEAPGYYDNRFAYCRCRWVFSGRGWVDPVKEANAAKIRMESGLSTLEQECAEQGMDWEEVLDQRAREKSKMKELGLELTEFSVTDQADPDANSEAQEHNSGDANADQ